MAEIILTPVGYLMVDTKTLSQVRWVTMTVQYLKQGLSTIHTWRGCPIQAKLMVYIPTTSVNSEVPMTSMEPMGIIPVNNSKQSQPTSGCKLNETFLNQVGISSLVAFLYIHEFI